MGTRCLFIFKQNFDAKEAHGVYVHYDGYPRGAADYLEETFNSDNTWTKLVRQTGCSRYEADEFASAFVATLKPKFKNGGGVRLVNLPHNIGDLDYQYTIGTNDQGNLIIDVIKFVINYGVVDEDHDSMKIEPVFNGTVYEFLESYAN
mgnify:FL=1